MMRNVTGGVVAQMSALLRPSYGHHTARGYPRVMSTAVVLLNVIMSLLVLCGLGAGVVVAARLRDGGGEGRASGRGPLHVVTH